jgi:hypothetical protein
MTIQRNEPGTILYVAMGLVQLTVYRASDAPAALDGGSHASVGKDIDGNLTGDKVDENAGLNGMQHGSLACNHLLGTSVLSVGHPDTRRVWSRHQLFCWNRLGRHARGPARIRPGATDRHREGQIGLRI